jgi:hypothetical protein
MQMSQAVLLVLPLHVIQLLPNAMHPKITQPTLSVCTPLISKHQASIKQLDVTLAEKSTDNRERSHRIGSSLVALLHSQEASFLLLLLRLQRRAARARGWAGAPSVRR